MNRMLVWLALGLALIGPAEAQKRTKYAVTVTLAGAGTGTVTSSPGGISCPGTCLFSFSGGTAVSLSAMTEPGSYFLGWDGACSGKEPVCLLESLQNNVSVSAVFELIPSGGIAGGNFLIVDNQGKIVSTRNLEDGTNVLIEYAVAGETHLVETRIAPAAIEPGGNLSASAQIGFESSDCSGTPHFIVNAYDAERWLDPRLAVTAYWSDGIRILYTAENPSSLDSVILSVLFYDESGNATCNSDLHWLDISSSLIFSVTGGIPISGWWDPPFHWK